MEIKNRIYRSGDIADCYTYALDEHQTTVKYQLKLIKQIEVMDADYGEERWTSLIIDPYSSYDIRSVPVEKLDWDEIGKPEERRIVTNKDYLNRLERMAQEGHSIRELLGNTD